MLARHSQRGLSVLEVIFLLVVIGFLAYILVPNFIRAKKQGSGTACKSNLKNIGVGLEMYSTDFRGFYPSDLTFLTPNYLKTLPECPQGEKVTYTEGYKLVRLGPGHVTCPNHTDEIPPECQTRMDAVRNKLDGQFELKFAELSDEERACPGGDEYSYFPHVTYVVHCWGANHTIVDLPENYPFYHGERGLVER